MYTVIIINVLVPTGIAVSLTTAANWTGNFVVAITTPVLIASQLQTYGTFYIYSLLLAAGLFFVLLTIPETKVRPHLSLVPRPEEEEKGPGFSPFSSSSLGRERG